MNRTWHCILSLLFRLCLCLCLSPVSGVSAWCGVVLWCRVSTQHVSVCTFKTSPCVPAPRAHMLKHVCAWCWYKKGTFWTCTRWRVFIGKTCVFYHVHDHLNRMLGSSLIDNFLFSMNGPYGLSRASEVHQRNPWEFTHLMFENRSNTARSRFLQSSALPDKAVQFQLSWWFCLSFVPKRSITNDLHVSIATSIHQSFSWLYSSRAACTIFQVPTVKITVGRRCTCPSIHFHCACSAHKQAKTHRHTDTQTHDTDTMCVAFRSHIYTCIFIYMSVSLILLTSYEKKQFWTRTFHDVYCSKHLTFQNGWILSVLITV